jgi:hypothetical protein
MMFVISHHSVDELFNVFNVVYSISHNHDGDDDDQQQQQHNHDDNNDDTINLNTHHNKIKLSNNDNSNIDDDDDDIDNKVHNFNHDDENNGNNPDDENDENKYKSYKKKKIRNTSSNKNSSSSSSSSRSSSSSSSSSVGGDGGKSSKRVGGAISTNKDEYENKKIVNTWINELINLKETKSIDIHNIDSIKHYLSSSQSSQSSSLISSSSSSSSQNQIQSSIVITYCIDLIQFLSSHLYSILIKTTTERDKLHQLENKHKVENEIIYENIRNYEKQCLFSNDPREIKYHSMTMMMEMKKNNNSCNEDIDNNYTSMNDGNDAGNDNNDGVKSNKKLLKIGSHLASFSKLDALRNINYHQQAKMLNLKLIPATNSTTTTATTTTITTTSSTINATTTMNTTVGIRNATIFDTFPKDDNQIKNNKINNSILINSNDKDSDNINHHHHNNVDNNIRSMGSRLDILTKFHTLGELLSMLNKIKSHALCDIVTLHDYIERKDEALKR